MIEYIPAAFIFLIEVVILVFWFKSRRNKDGKDKWLCFYGFLLGQIYILMEVMMIKQTGKPVPGSAEQKTLMLKLALGASIGGLFTLIGLLYLSFSIFPNRKQQ